MVFIRHAVTEWIRRIINDTQRCAEGYELSDGIVYRDEINEVRRKYREYNTVKYRKIRTVIPLPGG
ncbi:hypothetical protein DLW05_24165 [Escherichia coli]|nr:hypothetical protein [Escherichia coli]EFI4217464.1 hypothetical protein [Escherichia coli]EFN9182888.1 hypothetical protein [Escherichia coli]EGD9198744.1 hypothetical protein [Escherichia coli]EGE3833699.1 hypothetical protein [Escherichia coli]